MNRKLNIGLSIAAGLLGGLLSHYISPALVHAQTQAAPPKKIRAQSFVLVSADGRAAGLFGFDQDGQANCTAGGLVFLNSEKSGFRKAGKRWGVTINSLPSVPRNPTNPPRLKLTTGRGNNHLQLASVLCGHC
jgi:hypothetical protein